MNKFEFKNLTPFKWFVLENFPFIEADFDALTEWQLFCKLGKEMNKIIDSENTLGAQMENVTNAFIELQNYVNNYFKNLDVQDEINNKLNEMAQSGELTEIIAQYLQLAGLLCFNTKADLKNAENLIDGSFAKTFGNLTYNDGYGNYYKIRKIRNTDVIDDINIIALTNDIDLVAELIPNNYLNDILETVNNEMEIINNKINKIDYFNLELQPNIIYDLADSSHSQGSCVIGNILYVYVESNFPTGDIYKFDIENCTFIEKITNKQLYHGNDMCAIGNNIYVASCKDNSGNFANKTIVVFNTLNNTVTEINPFENIDKTYIFALAKYNEETLICALTNSQNFNDLGLYLYNINNGNITEISITNTDNIPTNIYYAFQSMEILG